MSEGYRKTEAVPCPFTVSVTQEGPEKIRVRYSWDDGPGDVLEMSDQAIIRITATGVKTT